MSAIAGVIQTDKEDQAWICGGKIMEALSHYPCDAAQAWQEDHIFLGCHNQWITPESIGERNPCYDPLRELVITADAIIDNRLELFNRLQVGPAHRETISDTELILLAYDKWGNEAPRHLVGDFAFMIWDRKKNKLFGARDFSGGRTLYYHRHTGRFAFCTTIEPLLKLSGTDRLLNEQWLAEYLAISGMVDTVDASKTVYLNIEQLPPSHSITIIGERMVLERYDQLQAVQPIRFKSDDQYVEAFQEVFQQAVSSRLRTNREVGAQLSGGLDSGSIVGFAARTLLPQNKKLHTFSYVPTDDFIDYTPKFMVTNERPFIEATVKHVGGIEDHYLAFEGRDSYSEIDGFLDIMEMPYKFFENSFWMKGMFEKAQEQGVGVLLNGGRGNLSISWGSAVPYYAKLLKKMSWFKLLREMRLYSLNTGTGRAHVFSNVSRKAFPILEQLRPSENEYHYPVIINADFAKRTDVFHRLRECGFNESGWFADNDIYKGRKSHFEELFHWNASNTLSTKLSLRYGLWKRDPTNDIRVIQYCLSLPEGQYVQKGMDRALIRRATDKLLPDQIRLNQRTRGVQGADWVHRMLPRWKDFMEELRQMSKDPTFMQYMDGKVVDSALSRLEEGAKPRHAIDPNYRLLMRSVILYRFLKKMT